MLDGSMAGKRALILGVANQRSIGWGIAQSLARLGVRLVFSYQGDRMKSMVEPLADEIGAEALLPCDVTDDVQIDALFDSIDEHWGGLDQMVHCLAFANREELGQEYMNTSRAGFALAQDVSAYSLVRLTRSAVPLMDAGSAIVTLSYLGGKRVIPGYSVMGVAKASLDMSVRYLAADLGSRNIRVNAVSAGPVKTLAARGVAHFPKILEIVESKAPMGRNVTIEEIGNAVAFLLSPMASAITGEVLHVDNGYSIMGL